MWQNHPPIVLTYSCVLDQGDRTQIHTSITQYYSHIAKHTGRWCTIGQKHRRGDNWCHYWKNEMKATVRFTAWRVYETIVKEQKMLTHLSHQSCNSKQWVCVTETGGTMPTHCKWHIVTSDVRMYWNLIYTWNPQHKAMFQGTQATTQDKESSTQWEKSLPLHAFCTLAPPLLSLPS